MVVSWWSGWGLDLSLKTNTPLRRPVYLFVLNLNSYVYLIFRGGLYSIHLAINSPQCTIYMWRSRRQYSKCYSPHITIWLRCFCLKCCVFFVIILWLMVRRAFGIRPARLLHLLHLCQKHIMRWTHSSSYPDFKWFCRCGRVTTRTLEHVSELNTRAQRQPYHPLRDEIRRWYATRLNYTRESTIINVEKAKSKKTDAFAFKFRALLRTNRARVSLNLIFSFLTANPSNTPTV